MHGARNRPHAPGPLFGAPVFGLAPGVHQDDVGIVDGVMNVETGRQTVQSPAALAGGRRDRSRRRRQVITRFFPGPHAPVQKPGVRMVEDLEQPDAARRPFAGLAVVEDDGRSVGHAAHGEQVLEHRQEGVQGRFGGVVEADAIEVEVGRPLDVAGGVIVGRAHVDEGDLVEARFQVGGGDQMFRFGESFVRHRVDLPGTGVRRRTVRPACHGGAGHRECSTHPPPGGRRRCERADGERPFAAARRHIQGTGPTGSGGNRPRGGDHVPVRLYQGDGDCGLGGPLGPAL